MKTIVSRETKQRMGFWLSLIDLNVVAD